MNIAVVILNWNGQALLEEFLPSVTQYADDAVIYVADNASDDNSVAFVREQYPEVHIIQNASNGGYAKGYNDALLQVKEEIVCLLNSDVEVTKNWLTPIRSIFDKNPNVAAIQPKILDYQNKAYFEYAGAGGGFIDQLGYPYCRGRVFDTLEEDLGQYNDTVPIFWASGAALCIRKSVFNEVGGFDEDFFAHQEEIDLCWRIHNLDYQILYTGNATVYHLGGATLNSMNPQKTFLNFRNTLFNLIKNVPGGIVWWLISVRLLLDGIAGFKFLIQGKGSHFLAILKAHFSFYRQLPSFLKKRKKHSVKKKYYTLSSVIWKYFVLQKKHYHKL